jgi:hypothetical protein
MERARILKAERIQSFDKDLRLWSRPELMRYFGTKKSRRILIKPLVKNLVWQASDLDRAARCPKH